MRTLALAMAVSLVAPACADASKAEAEATGVPLPSGKADNASGACPDFTGPYQVGELEADAADEVSGVVASRALPGVFWALDDAGGEPVLFAFDRQGRDLAQVTLGAGTRNRDWEDLALGPGPEAGVDYLYVADTGDNDRTRESARIYRLAEPAVSPGVRGDAWVDEAVEEARLEYADGERRNAEALLVDPLDGEIYVVSRAEPTELTEVLRVTWPAAPGEDGALDVVLDETEAPGLLGAVVAGDVSADGAVVALGFRGGATRLWRRTPGQSIPEALRGEPCAGPEGPPDNGSLALTDDGWSWTMVPEGAGAAVSMVRPATTCPAFGELDERGRVRDAAAIELSGLVESPGQGVLWTHNDGDGNLLLALSPDGEVAGAFWLEGSPAEDWEDLALGPGPDPDTTWLYAADTGDNALSRKHVQLVRFAEPTVDASMPGVQTLTDYEVFELEYPGKAEHDGEALVVDPVDGEVYLFTKRNQTDERTRVYRVPTLDPTEKVELELVLDERDSPFLDGTLVAGDVTAAGDWLVLLARDEEARLWRRADGAPLWEALLTPPCVGPIAPGQVESVALAAERDGYWMVPEGPEPRLSFVPFE